MNNDFELDPDRSQHKLKNLVAIASSQYPTLAIRPAYSVLNTEKISKKFGLYPLDWQESYALMMACLR